MKLFEGEDVFDEDISNIAVDKDFARRYEHNKKREDLQKLEEMKKKGLVPDSDSDDDDSSSDESVEDELIDPKKDLEFLNALIKVKNQHPDLKNAEAKLFDSEDEEEDDEETDGVREKGDKKKKKPMYLKDVTAKHLIEGGAEFEDEDAKKKKVKSYSEEQELLRREFLDAAEEAFVNEEDGELLKEKRGEVNGDEDSDDDGEVEKKLDEYFGGNDNLDENEMFLKEYFKNKMWVGADEKALDNMDLDVSEEEELIEKQEEYEKSFNFRFEENPGDRVLGHSRVVEGSVRKKTNARKVQRQSKEERMAQAEFERKEELKHLKNLKKKEMKDMLKKIRETAGFSEEGACPLDEDYLEEEFDPEEYDKKMKVAFDDDYYDADDADPEFGSDGDEEGKPDFDKEDELLGLGKGWDDVSGSGDGFLAIREQNLKRKAEKGKGKEIEADVEDEEGKKKKKQKLSELEKEVIQKELEEYYKLDYEDTVGDLKTRFKYKEVGARSYGLKTEEILGLDDKELNQYVSIKKIAPYREKEWTVPKNLKHNQKQRNKQILKGETINEQTTGKKKLKNGDRKTNKEDDGVENDKARVQDSNGDGSKKSRKSKRKERQAELKLSESRKKAYGIIPAESKKKRKD